MSLESKVQEALKSAMKNKDQAAMRSLRAVKSAILLIKTDTGFTGEVTEEQELALLQKLVKQRKESLDIFEKQNRADLAVKEQEEITVIEQFLPEQLSEEEITTTINAIIEKTGASSMKDMGKVMGMATKELAGRADGKLIATIVKARLA